jgi:hypothetical protein
MLCQGHSRLGFIYTYFIEHEKALACFERALELNPCDSTALKLLPRAEAKVSQILKQNAAAVAEQQLLADRYAESLAKAGAQQSYTQYVQAMQRSRASQLEQQLQSPVCVMLPVGNSHSVQQQQQSTVATALVTAAPAAVGGAAYSEQQQQQRKLTQGATAAMPTQQQQQKQMMLQQQHSSSSSSDHGNAACTVTTQQQQQQQKQQQQQQQQQQRCYNADTVAAACAAIECSVNMINKPSVAALASQQKRSSDIMITVSPNSSCNGTPKYRRRTVISIPTTPQSTSTTTAATTGRYSTRLVANRSPIINVSGRNDSSGSSSSGKATAQFALLTSGDAASNRSFRTPRHHRDDSMTEMRKSSILNLYALVTNSSAVKEIVSPIRNKPRTASTVGLYSSGSNSATAATSPIQTRDELHNSSSGNNGGSVDCGQNSSNWQKGNGRSGSILYIPKFIRRRTSSTASNSTVTTAAASAASSRKGSRTGSNDSSIAVAITSSSRERWQSLLDMLSFETTSTTAAATGNSNEY